MFPFGAADGTVGTWRPEQRRHDPESERPHRSSALGILLSVVGQLAADSGALHVIERDNELPALADSVACRTTQNALLRIESFICPNGIGAADQQVLIVHPGLVDI
jgi:hypothetical protein